MRLGRQACKYLHSFHYPYFLKKDPFSRVQRIFGLDGCLGFVSQVSRVPAGPHPQELLRKWHNIYTPHTYRPTVNSQMRKNLSLVFKETVSQIKWVLQYTVRVLPVYEDKHWYGTWCIPVPCWPKSFHSSTSSCIWGTCIRQSISSFLDMESILRLWVWPVKACWRQSSITEIWSDCTVGATVRSSEQLKGFWPQSSSWPITRLWVMANVCKFVTGQI